MGAFDALFEELFGLGQVVLPQGLSGLVQGLVGGALFADVLTDRQEVLVQFLLLVRGQLGPIDLQQGGLGVDVVKALHLLDAGGQQGGGLVGIGVLGWGHPGQEEEHDRGGRHASKGLTK